MNIEYALSQLRFISVNLDLLGMKRIAIDISKLAVWLSTRPHTNEDSRLPPSLFGSNVEYELECKCSGEKELYTFNVPSINKLVCTYYLSKALEWVTDIAEDSNDEAIINSAHSYIDTINYILSYLK